MKQTKKRKKGSSTGKSRYAAKVDSGRQMYGGRGDNSCCAHRIRSSYIQEEPRR